MLLLSVRRPLKITRKPSVVDYFQQNNRKNFVLAALVLVLVPQSSASRNFEKFPFNRLIVINKIRQISRKKLDFPKLTETRTEIL